MVAPSTLNSPTPRKEWSGSYRGVPYRISLHGEGESYTPGGEGTWCFYLFFREEAVPNFKAIWLRDKVYKWKSDAKGRIIHDYMRSPLANIEWHGGITYYAKHGHTAGFRCVEAGCDYAHLWDIERGGGFTVEGVLRDAHAAIDSAYGAGLLAPEPTPTPAAIQ